MDQQQPANKPTKGYGGRSKRFWILAYLVLAIIVYFIIYWVWIRKPGGSGGSSGGGLGY